jgi:hypothetical protein
MAMRLGRMGIELRWVQGFTYPRYAHCKPWPAVFGSGEAHRVCMTAARRRGEPQCLILEDDCVFRDDAVQVLDAALKELQGKKWDILFWGGSVLDGTYERVSEHVARVQNVGGTHAWVLNMDPATVAKMSEMFDYARDEASCGLSTLLGQVKDFGLVRYACRPMCVAQEDGPSLIGDPNQQKFTQALGSPGYEGFAEHCSEMAAAK